MKIESFIYDFHGKYFLKDCFSVICADQIRRFSEIFIRGNPRLFLRRSAGKF